MNRKFTDIHCHIIPDVDDGATDMTASMQLVDEAYAEGIRCMIATPHFGVINPQYDPERVAGKFDELVTAVAEIHPDMKLYLGNEIYLAPGYPDGLTERNLIASDSREMYSNTLAGSRYVLVEFPMDIDYEFIYYSFRRLLIAGYTPVFAHAERYRHVYRNINTLAEIVNMGVLIQINSSSISDKGPVNGAGANYSGKDNNAEIRRDDSVNKGGFLKGILGLSAGKNRQEKFVTELIKAGFVHFVATDCHDMPGRHPTMLAAADKLVELIGTAAAERILIDNPKWIVGA